VTPPHARRQAPAPALPEDDTPWYVGHLMEATPEDLAAMPQVRARDRGRRQGGCF
jgi:hypothetical protein